MTLGELSRASGSEAGLHKSGSVANRVQGAPPRSAARPPSDAPVPNDIFAAVLMLFHDLWESVLLKFAQR